MQRLGYEVPYVGMVFLVCSDCGLGEQKESRKGIINADAKP